MSWLTKFLSSSIGNKVIMALTGVVLLCFVIGHLVGNLLIYAGPDAINEYAAFLKSKPALVWTARSVLLVVVLLHIFVATRLFLMNRAARPQDYAFKATVQASLASRTMIITGLLILVYVVYHLLHFTVGAVHTDTYDRVNVYAMIVNSYNASWICVIVYVVANAMLTWHLSHGIASLFQTLGINDERYNPIISKVGLILAALIGAAYISIPVSVRLGLIAP